MLSLFWVFSALWDLQNHLLSQKWSQLYKGRIGVFGNSFQMAVDSVIRWKGGVNGLGLNAPWSVQTWPAPWWTRHSITIAVKNEACICSSEDRELAPSIWPEKWELACGSATFFFSPLTGGGFTESTSSFLLLFHTSLGPVRSARRVMQATRQWGEGGGWCSEAMEGVLELSGGVVEWWCGSPGM